MAKKKTLVPVVRLAIASDHPESNSQFARGIATLCLGVREKGSLNAAAKDIHMAYSKAWRIIKDVEAELGFQLLDRDGAHGSTLTPEGDKLLDAYLRVTKKLETMAAKEFEKIYSK